MQCKICKRECKNNRSLALHLKKHNLSFLEYHIQYEGFVVPKCLYCSNDAKYKGDGLFFRKTCTSNECISELKKSKKHSKETKKKLSDKRLSYMKENPDNTAWRLGNKPSYPEQIFIDCIEKNGLFEKFEIVREKSFFPYYVDFAFINVKVAVEIDGSQHLNEEIKKRDAEKDKLLLSQGWRVYRVTASQIEDNSIKIINELLNFIGDVKNVSMTSQLITGKEQREQKRQKEKVNTSIKKAQAEFDRLFRIYDLIYLYGNNRGIIGNIAKELNVSHTQVRRILNKYKIEL